MHSARTAEDVIFGGELRMLADRGGIRLVERHTADDGRLDWPSCATLVPDLASERETWACGPAEMLDAVEAHVRRRSASSTACTPSGSARSSWLATESAAAP